MFANFTKKEFHEFLLWYIDGSVKGLNYSVEEEEPIWVEFIDFLKARQVESFLVTRKMKTSMRVRTFGKAVNEKLLAVEPDKPVKVLF